MKKVWRLLLLCVVLFVILPCVIVLLFQKSISMLFYGMEKTERYLPGILYDITDSEMHIETLKAQAVLVRSNVIKAIQEGKVTYKELYEKYSLTDRKMEEQDMEFYDRLVRACRETEGEVVVYNSEICYCPFFYSSCGTTRDAFSFFQDDSYPYLVAVPSHRDEESKSYITYHYFSIEEFSNKMNELCEGTFQNQIQILEKDESDYITWLKVGDAVVGGEIFRKALGLSSGCFSIEQENDGIRITCKGRGHGFGFSQYGANAMAADKKEYQELIEYYFHNITIENVYRFS